MGQHGYLRLAAALGGLAVVIGAFGAHGLEEIVPDNLMEVFEIGARYHMYHALAMLALALGPAPLWHCRWAKAACWAWLGGIMLFSGSLYTMALTDQGWLGAITPIGGLAFIAGWLFVGMAARPSVFISSES
jgi:uncharacterized membrane protein YgdD (TMEM256/DUF423 family)